MRRWTRGWIVVLLFLGVVFVPLPLAHAQDEPYPIVLAAGETFDVCSSGQIVCPARNTICDDPKVALPVDVPNGLGFKGIAPGTTLCSAASAVGPRRIFRITVH
ncbi:MAG: hypothetical protein WCF31_01810 [Candidatus Deferrimicrobiaceae bacterium]